MQRNYEVKNSERWLQGEETGHQFQSIANSTDSQTMGNFLSRTTDNLKLVYIPCFIVSDWKSVQHREKLRKCYFSVSNITSEQLISFLYL